MTQALRLSVSNSQSELLDIVIPVWKSSGSLIALLDELSGHFAITIVENHSDDLLQLPDRFAKTVQHIKLATNTGFAHAANVGWQSGESDFYLFLNPDTKISADQVSEILAEGQAQNLQAFSPLLVNESGEIAWNYHQSLPSVLSLLQQFSPLSRVLPIMNPRISQDVLIGRTLPGACLFVSRQALESCGGWDERFWLWWEDADLSARLHQQNISIATLTTQKVRHTGAETFRQKTDDWKNQVFFHGLRLYIHKHFPAWQSLFQPLWQKRQIARLLPLDSVVRSSIVVPSMKADLLERFLEQVSPDWDWKQDELIVISSSTDSWHLQQKYPEVSFIWLSKPIGFAKTVNLGWDRARGQWIGTVNDDTLLPKNFVADLTSDVSAKTGSIQSKIVSPAGVIESLGVAVTAAGKASGLSTVGLKVDTVNAAAVLFSREALEDVGFFDESFESYLEDVDLGLRMSSAGWQHAVEDSVVVTHLKHQTMKLFPTRKAYLDMRNWWKIVLKPYWREHWKNHAIQILAERARNVSGFLKSLSKRGN